MRSSSACACSTGSWTGPETADGGRLVQRTHTSRSAGAVTTGASGSRSWRGLALVCLAGVIWGTIGPGVDLVHGRSGLSSLTIGAYRSVAAVLTLWVAVLLTGRGPACRELLMRRWRRVVVLGLLTAGFMLLFFVAVLAVGVSVATVVSLGVAPLLLLALTSAQRRQPPGPHEVGTVLAAVLGLGLVGLSGGGQGGGPVWVGLLAAVAAGSAYGVSADVGVVITRHYDALAITTLTMTVAALVLVPGGLLVAWGRGESLTTDDASTWALLAYLGAVTMSLAYVLLFAGMRSTPSGAVVVATLLEPVTAVVIAVGWLGERLTTPAAVGTLSIVAAIGSLGPRGTDPQPQ